MRACDTHEWYPGADSRNCPWCIIKELHDLNARLKTKLREADEERDKLERELEACQDEMYYHGDYIDD